MSEETDYAFPHQYKSAPNQLTVCLGMTLRDYFAAKAMQGFASNLGPGATFETRAAIAYQWADAMMEARK